jgi:phospholipase C
VKPGRRTTVKWPLDRWGYYDVIVEAPGGFRHRFAGRVE